MLIGNLGRDPDLQYLEGNIAVAKFPLATTETFKDKNGNLVSQTEWHTVVLWRGLAELAQKYLHKGSLVFLDKRKENGTEFHAAPTETHTEVPDMSFDPGATATKDDLPF
jgi:single-strand DNA-binding protein